MNEFKLSLQSSIIVLLAVLAFVSIIVGFMASERQVFGGVEVGGEYNATTTYAAHPLDERTIKTGQGTLGSVVITGDNTGLITFYNATTSNVSLRTGNKATSSITIADFPASTAEGTYVIDATFTDGLLMITSGTEATSTVTWR